MIECFFFVAHLARNGAKILRLWSFFRFLGFLFSDKRITERSARKLLLRFLRSASISVKFFGFFFGLTNLDFCNDVAVLVYPVEECFRSRFAIVWFDLAFYFMPNWHKMRIDIVFDLLIAFLSSFFRACFWLFFFSRLVCALNTLNFFPPIIFGGLAFFEDFCLFSLLLYE